MVAIVDLLGNKARPEVNILIVHAVLDRRNWEIGTLSWLLRFFEARRSEARQKPHEARRVEGDF